MSENNTVTNYIPKNLIRHELRVGIEDKAIESLKEDIELDEKLGLHRQAQITNIKALRHDIDVLTNSRDYMEISIPILAKLFQIKKLQRMCAPHNIKEYTRELFLNFKWNIFFTILSAALITFEVYYCKSLDFSKLDPLFFFLLSGVAFVAAIAALGFIMCIFFYTGRPRARVDRNGNVERLSGRSIVFDLNLLKVILKQDAIEDCLIPLPRGAKLKLMEAMDSKIFKDFKIIWPDYEFQKIRKEMILPSTDPAIVGITSDNRMYMIVCWDIENDIEKTATKIKQLKKYKLPNKHKFSV